MEVWEHNSGEPKGEKASRAREGERKRMAPIAPSPRRQMRGKKALPFAYLLV